jgi:hypothetical protein
MLIRLFVLGGRIIALTGRGPEGEPGGELAIALCNPSLRQNVGIVRLSYTSWNRAPGARLAELNKRKLCLQSSGHLSQILKRTRSPIIVGCFEKRRVRLCG